MSQSAGWLRFLSMSDATYSTPYNSTWQPMPGATIGGVNPIRLFGFLSSTAVLGTNCHDPISGTTQDCITSAGFIGSGFTGAVSHWSNPTTAGPSGPPTWTAGAPYEQGHSVTYWIRASRDAGYSQ